MFIAVVLQDARQDVFVSSILQVPDAIRLLGIQELLKILDAQRVQIRGFRALYVRRLGCAPAWRGFRSRR